MLLLETIVEPQHGSPPSPPPLTHVAPMSDHTRSAPVALCYRGGQRWPGSCCMCCIGRPQRQRAARSHHANQAGRGGRRDGGRCRVSRHHRPQPERHGGAHLLGSSHITPPFFTSALLYSAHLSALSADLGPYAPGLAWKMHPHAACGGLPGAAVLTEDPGSCAVCCVLRAAVPCTAHREVSQGCGGQRRRGRHSDLAACCASRGKAWCRCRKRGAVLGQLCTYSTSAAVSPALSQARGIPPPHLGRWRCPEGSCCHACG